MQTKPVVPVADTAVATLCTELIASTDGNSPVGALRHLTDALRAELRVLQCQVEQARADSAEPRPAPPSHQPEEGLL